MDTMGDLGVFTKLTYFTTRTSRLWFVNTNLLSITKPYPIIAGWNRAIVNEVICLASHIGKSVYCIAVYRLCVLSVR